MENIKDSYTLIELIQSLRFYYQQSQILLDRMKQYIQVESIEPYNTELKLNLRDEFLNKIEEPSIILHVSKDIKTSLGVRIRKVMNDISYREVRSIRDNALFNLEGEPNNYRFTQRKRSYFTNYYEPKVIIPNNYQEMFTEHYEDLLQTKLYSLQSLYIRINPFQSLFIWGDTIELTSEGENGKGISLTYNAIDNKIHIDSKKNYSTFFIEELLETRIPSYLFPEEYLKILTEQKQISRAFIDDFVGYSKETLSLNEQHNHLILKRSID